MEENNIKQNILRFFEKSRGNYISGEEISNNLGMSRANIWKHINALRQEGYMIDAVPNIGYKLLMIPDKLQGYEIKNGLETSTMGQHIYYYDYITSTNDKAYELAENGAKEGTIIVAETQSGGKARLERKWISPLGGIYMSIILRPVVNIEEIPAVTLVSALSVSKTITSLYNLKAEIKWPNDIFINSQKICGILAEMKGHVDKVDFVILGIGININTAINDLPPNSTSIKTLTKNIANRVIFAREFLKQFESDYTQFINEGFKSLKNECAELSTLIGKKVNIKMHNTILSGLALGIDDKGALIIKNELGDMKRVLSGDVLMCR
ncbi:biotin operon repressor/biotin--[acetyl-CoA-carboxylase] synthetase [Candidatus Omnitrophus magneticus]|uniref:Bifunctional ligase/repressor BirA n=1 Tax=Candidatus Omnitrophus magneticus TaxID=1609969 RepID=A0A0F0CPH7_9BACT|nr:biotin operon repressor/biotin--[acetyl-CoA-carboxylase] synthetase [Candidatus Omnitrophus magneticus]